MMSFAPWRQVEKFLELSSPEVGGCLGSYGSKSEGSAEEAKHRNCTKVPREANECVWGVGGKRS